MCEEHLEVLRSYSSVQMPEIVLGAYTLWHLRRKIRNKSRHTAVKTRTGTKVPPSDESEAESVLEGARRVTVPPVELSRLEPTLGSSSSLFTRKSDFRTRHCKNGQHTSCLLPNSRTSDCHFSKTCRVWSECGIVNGPAEAISVA